MEKKSAPKTRIKLELMPEEDDDDDENVMC